VTEHSGRSRRVGPYITIGTVAVVLVAACLTIFGLGAFDRAVAVYDPTAWLFSKTKGELGRVNGNTARVDTRVKVQGTTGHRVEVTQSDRYLIVRDLDTGVVSSLDLATLQIAASLQTPPGQGVRFVLHGNAAYVIDEVHGQVRQVDPLTLKPIGAPLSFSPGMTGGDFDGDGKLWFALPSEGTVVSLTPAAKSGQQPAVQTESITQPSHDLAVSVLDKGVAVLDQTAAQLVTVRGTQITKTALQLTEQGLVAPRTSGDQVPVTVPDTRMVDAVAPRSVAQFTVPGTGNSLSPAVAWAGWYYVADDSADVVYVLNQAGNLVDQIQFPGQAGDLELQVRDDYLYINAVDGTTARVVNRSHKVSSVDKYPNDVPGGDPPPVPPTPASPPPPPPAGPPGPPSSVVASAGNATVHLTWGAAPSGGSRILRYVVEGDGRTFTVGTGQRALDVPNLTNGQTYTFHVYAVNAKGDGPARDSNPVVPTSDVPDPPASVTAQEQKDGTVSVSWPAGNGLGHQVSGYQVTATGPDGPAQTWQVGGAKTGLVTPAGSLTYGTQYAFTVTTVNDKGAGSKPSPMSNSVVPYALPSAPTNVHAVTGAEAGVVSVSWAAAEENGRPVTGYVVSYDGQTKSVSGATKVDLTGLTGGQSVTVTVVAINAAGTGPKSKAVTAAAIAAPALTLGKVTTSYNSATIPFTVNDGGGTATCKLTASGAGSSSASCSSLTVGGLAPGVAYTLTVSVTNQVGTATKSASATTTVLNGTVVCVNPKGATYCTTIGLYSHPAQQTGYAVGEAKNGTRFQAICQAPGGSNTQQGGGTTLTSGPYNPGKGNNYKSSKWVKITGNRYIPYIWFNLDGGDDISLLPACP
jgi:hypothetical protein